MLLLRLSPIIPFNATNYIGGVTGVRWEIFSLAILGIIPMQALTIAAGASARSISYHDAMSNDESRTAQYVFVLVGLIFGFIAVVLTWIYARIELKKEIELAKQNEASLAKGGQNQSHQKYLDSAKLHALSEREMGRMDKEAAETDNEARLTQSMPATLHQKIVRGFPPEKENSKHDVECRDNEASQLMAGADTRSQGGNSLDQTSCNDDSSSSFDADKYDIDDQSNGDEEWFWVWI
uniref:Golgi apparatus membrane protein TVP38 n=2 Tax=Ditylum brightwellii TaxID=49249 RepID=A0A7S4TB37_9STRA